MSNNQIILKFAVPIDTYFVILLISILELNRKATVNPHIPTMTKFIFRQNLARR